MAEKKTNKERLKEITDSIEAGIQELFQSEKYMDYLRTMSRFHKYSFNNTMLIHLQKPDAMRASCLPISGARMCCVFATTVPLSFKQG